MYSRAFFQVTLWFCEDILLYVESHASSLLDVFTSLVSVVTSWRKKIRCIGTLDFLQYVSQVQKLKK